MDAEPHVHMGVESSVSQGMLVLQHILHIDAFSCVGDAIGHEGVEGVKQLLCSISQERNLAAVD